MLQLCLKCHMDNELPEGHKLRVCRHCGAIQAKVSPPTAPPSIQPQTPPPAAVDVAAGKYATDTANPPSLIGCATCGHNIARLAATCPACGAPNDLAPKVIAQKPPSLWGGTAIACALAAVAMPYFAAVFLAPLASIIALVAITKNQAIAGIAALALCFLAFLGIWQTSQKIAAVQVELGKSADEMKRIQDKLERDLRDIRQKYQ